MNVLVAVASKHGSTRAIAKTIADELRTAGVATDLHEVGEFDDFGEYDAVVFGSAIYAGHWLPEAKQFAERHRAELATVPVWLFSSGPLGAPDPRPHDDPRQLAAPMGPVEIRDHRVFAGKLDKSSLGLRERLIVRAIGAPEGDFRDWEAIRSWAGEIGTALAERQAASAGG